MWTAQIPALKSNWKQVLELEPLLVVFFCAEWSPPDHLMGAVLRRVTPEFQGQFALFAVNIEDENFLKLSVEAAVMTNPQLVAFRFGKPNERVLGYMNEASLRSLFQKWAQA